ncbi:hypothetical protein EXIGLDRAFT_671991 [Exidia glandulosa HHB12029]|uniref:RINT-1 family protein n=1 Tax=Exidia glandulosa HHB12029 TaxID=1314781 RepID=A0A165JZY5_EXIGL|nr:hypothetical protein EXIGLDRAFT_671991 [Exidia glandulosa HHB12029]
MALPLTATRIRELVQPPDAKLATNSALEHINAQFSSLDAALDVEALERAVAAARQHSDVLDAKASASSAETEKLIADTLTAVRAHLVSAQELSLARHALTDELTSLSEEMVSSVMDPDRQPTLMEELETLQRTLHELESVRDYVGVIHHALGLSESAIKEMREAKKPLSPTHPAIEQYKTLQAFVSSVQETCVNVEGGSVTLVSLLESVQRKTWAGIKDVLVSDLLAASEELKWPLPVKYDQVPPEHRAAFEKAFSNLLRLQDIGTKLHPTDSTRPTPLYALQGLVHPVALRFKFHFESDRPTNRPDKPEWFFTNILNVSHEHRVFLETYVQQLLDKASYGHIDAWREFTRLLFPILVKKMRATVPLLLPHPSLLAHMIYQALAFDASLREAGFDLKGTMATARAKDKDKDPDEGEWDGLADVILTHHEWFEAWLDAERRFDEDQYLEIISASDAWAIADDEDEDVNAEDGVGRSRSDVRATNSARRVKALIEQVTDRYQSLPRLPQRVRFLLHVQMPIIDQYRTRITASLDAFEALSSALARAVPGGLTGQVDMGARRLTSGVEGASRLVKALISARAVEGAMVIWGEDVFFLELWAEMNRRPALRALAESHTLLPPPSKDPAAEPEGTVFDTLVDAYRDVCSRAEDMIVRQIVGEIEDDLRPYITAPWDADSDILTLPPALAASVTALAAHINFLRATLPATVTVSLYRNIASTLAAYIVQRGIVYRGRARASHAHGVKFAAEARAWVDASRAALQGQPARRVEAPWTRLLSASRLIALEGDEWEQAVDGVFGVDEAAYEELGLVDLSKADAREIVRAREDCRR